MYGNPSPLVESLLVNGYSVRLRVTGGSMHPTIRAGDVLMLEAIDSNALRKGDVVLARQSGRLVAHRIAEITKNASGRHVRLRGDALPCCDPSISADAILARVVALERGGSRRAVRSAAGARFVGLAWRFGALAKRAAVRTTVLLPRICRETVPQRHIESY
jgi:signal peptidase I